MLDLIVLHGEFSLFTVRGNFWYQIYQNQRQKILCQLMALITLSDTSEYVKKQLWCMLYLLILSTLLYNK